MPRNAPVSTGLLALPLKNPQLGRYAFGAAGDAAPVWFTDNATLRASIHGLALGHAAPGKHLARLPLRPMPTDRRQTKSDRDQTTVGAGA